DSVEIARPIEQVDSELTFLLADVRGLFEPEIVQLSDLVPNMLSKYGRKIRPSSRVEPSFNSILEYAKQYWDVRSKVSPIALGLPSEFERLDLMYRSGWSSEILEVCHKAIRDRLEGADIAAADRNNLEDLEYFLRRLGRTLRDLATESAP